MEKCNLIVTDAGDPSTGCWPTSWLVECPFTEKLAREEPEIANEFLNSIVSIYNEWSEGRCSADFDFILKENFND